MRRTRTATMAIVALVALALALPEPASASVVDRLVFPQDASVTTFSDSWRAPRSGGRRHAGTDLLAPKLSPVYAAADGVVTRLHQSRLGGHGLWIDHGDGVVTVYLHLNNDTPGTDDGKGFPAWTYAPGIAEGVAVAAGQFVGFVGDSGNAERTVPHTHFELHLGGRKVNPYPYLRVAHDAALAALDTAPIAFVAAPDPGPWEPAHGMFPD